MKKQIFSLALLISSFSAFTQNDETTPPKEETKFDITANGNLGFAKLEQTGQPKLNGFINSGEFLFSMKIAKNTKIGTGIGLMEFDANTFSNGENANIQNTYLQIPVSLNWNLLPSSFKGQSENFKIIFGFGGYANHLLKQELETTSGNTKEKGLGWNFGLSTQLGMKMKISDCFSFGIGYKGQSDLNKMEKNNVKRKLINANTFYFSVGVDF
ncbi:outer membrane beta-barrel protein [Mangrovimonas aestuarii]|uniref:outer membrane beta-barrel protein n=1 Tax=Mangrovimonas aestuarii TaxID=3018443 RepID=UPI0023797C49|nr:outer membrane beta-barrel protein [Mangrovimonas aestuarii]